MEQESSTPFGLESLPGQQILPGFKEAMRVDVHSLKPFDEEFCQLYVELGDTGKAYQAAAKKYKDKEVSDLQAQKNGSALRKKQEISRRIAQYQAVTRAAVHAELIDSCLRDMRFDPAVMFGPDGKQRRVFDLTSDQRKGFGLESRIVDGEVVFVEKFPDGQKGRDTLVKIGGYGKESLEISGPDGGPMEMKISGMSPIQRAARISHLLRLGRDRAAAAAKSDASGDAGEP